MAGNCDKHYLITRIINPEISWFIAFRKDGRVRVHYRVMGSDFYQRTIDPLIEELEKWRDDIWYEYGCSPKALEEYLKILERYNVDCSDLWLLADRIADYLGVYDISYYSIHEFSKIDVESFTEYNPEPPVKKKFLLMSRHKDKMTSVSRESSIVDKIFGIFKRKRE